MKLAAFTLLLSFSTLALAEKPKMTPEQQEMMAKWKEMATPGEMHKMLAGVAGKWTYTSRSWEKPEASPEESKGTSTFSMLFGGRFLQQDVKGTAMGQPFHGRSLVGYDNLKQQFQTVWMDDMSTSIMHGTGTYDANTKTITDSGEFTCPMDDDKTANYRSEWKLTDKNNMTYTMYANNMKGINKEFKMMEMIYKRSK